MYRILCHFYSSLFQLRNIIQISKFQFDYSYLKLTLLGAGIDIITEDLLCETTGVLGLSTFSAPTETQDGLKSYNDTSEINIVDSKIQKFS